MPNRGKIFLATLIGLLIFLGSVTRFHHHLDGAEICFCSGMMSGHICNHSHDCGDQCNKDAATGNHNNDSEDKCPLHLDIFIISDNQDIDIPTLCCHHHCDLCAPLAYNDDVFTQKITYRPFDVPLLQWEYSSDSNRRGPPVC